MSEPWTVHDRGAFISVLLVGEAASLAESLVIEGHPETEPDGFRVRALPDPSRLVEALVAELPHVLITTGDVADVPELLRQPLEVRRRWLHFDQAPATPALVESVLNAALATMTQPDRFPETPLVSVFTPLYRTGERLHRAHRSLLEQTYDNWEWVLYDDSPELETFRLASSLANSDPRIRVFRSDRNCGVIGEVKRRACGLARGDILVEFDHDDELTDHCLGDVVEAALLYPDAGFFYTDCAEIDTDSFASLTYGPGWGMSYGSYRQEAYRDRTFVVTNYPMINAATMRHIVGVPNHVRAWRRSAYLASGGFSGEIPVADDYELIIRTFLVTRIVHIQRFGYIQHIDRSSASNTHRVRNAEIQRLVRLLRWRYEDRIHARILELAGEDFMYGPNGFDWEAPRPDYATPLNYILR
jgi:glycosyltransferase involved in cell wall biosynthesis